MTATTQEMYAGFKHQSQGQAVRQSDNNVICPQGVQQDINAHTIRFSCNSSICVITKTMSKVTSSYAGVFAADLPTVEEMKVKSRDDVKDFLNERRAELDLEDEDINKLHDQR